MATKSSNGNGASTTNRLPAADRTEEVVVAAPNLCEVALTIRGDAPYVMHKFSEKSRKTMRATQEEGSKAKGKKTREPRNFDQEVKEATHFSTEGWIGLPAPGIRAALISACRVAGLVMTRAKLSIFVLPDGFDADDGTPLVRITKGEPKAHEAAVRLESGVASVVCRPMWAPGWEAVVRIKYDGDQFSLESVCNLLSRAGQQVGIGEGRPDSKRSCGVGWGTFVIARPDEQE